MTLIKFRKRLDLKTIFWYIYLVIGDYEVLATDYNTYALVYSCTSGIGEKIFLNYLILKSFWIVRNRMDFKQNPNTSYSDGSKADKYRSNG